MRFVRRSSPLEGVSAIVTTSAYLYELRRGPLARNELGSGNASLSCLRDSLSNEKIEGLRCVSHAGSPRVRTRRSSRLADQGTGILRPSPFSSLRDPPARRRCLRRAGPRGHGCYLSCPRYCVGSHGSAQGARFAASRSPSSP